MNLTLECEQEEDGRWLAEVPQLPGVLAECLERDQAAPVTINMSIPLVA